MEFRGVICFLLRACISLGMFLNVCEGECPMFLLRGSGIVCITETNGDFAHYEYLYPKVSSRCSKPIMNIPVTTFTNVDCKLKDINNIFRNELLPNVRVFSSRSESPNSILYPNSLHLFDGVKEITFSSANIERIEPGTFDRTRSVTRLDLSRNRIETLPPELFDNMRNLKRLDLSYNFMANLRIGIFKNLFRLEMLILSSCTLESLDPNLFLNLTRMEALFLSGNKIKRLESDTFSGNIRLNRLEISYNEITYLSTDAFPKNNKLMELHMSGNKFREISSETFHNLIKLRLLGLEENEITTLKDKPFRKLKYLGSLFLSGNKLPRIGCSEFLGLTYLGILDISSNSIESVESCAFKDMQNDLSLYLDSNMLNALDTRGGTFEDVGDLFLRNNKLVDLSNVFLNSSIRDLYLDGNFNLVLSNDTFAGMRKLYSLSMKSCNITFLPEGMFRNTPQLQNLYLKDNFIREIDLSGHPFTNLRTLDLSYNRIELLHVSGYPSNHLMLLDLSYNRIQRLNVSSLKTIEDLKISHNSISKLEGSEHLKSLSEFDASFNNLTVLNLCTPGSSIFPRFRSRLNLSHNLISSLSNSFCKESRIENLDLSHNNLSGITDDQWRIILCIQKFDASNNHIREIIIPETFDCNSRLYHEMHFENNEVKSIRLPEVTERRIPSKAGEPRYIDLTFEIYMSRNPILCGCLAYEVYHYLKQFDISRNYINIRDELTCHDPPKLQGKKFRELEPTDFWCDYQDECVNGSLCSPASDCDSRCRCYYRPHDNVRIVDCSNSSFEELPTDVPRNIELLYVEHNSFKSLAGLNRPLWQNLTQIHAEYNDVESEHIPIPANVILLSLKGNKLRKFPPSIQIHAENKSNFKVTLSENLWPCECSVLSLKAFLLEHPSKVIDLDNVTCSFPDGSSLVLNKASDLDLCPTIYHMIPLFLSIAAAVFFFIIGVCIWLYYNYKIYILALLYVRCNWCYRLLFCDRRIRETKIFDGFIAYSSHDTETVVEIVRELEPEYQFCVHQRNWLAGSPIINNIFYSVQNSRKSLMILSAEFLRSQWFPLEFDAAFKQAVEDRRDRMIVIVKGDLPPQSELPEEVRYVLTTRTYLRWGDPWFFDKLRFAMQEEQPFMRRQMHRGSSEAGSCLSCLSSGRSQAQEDIEQIPLIECI